jgi:ribosomal protein L11 methyltransferase
MAVEYRRFWISARDAVERETLLAEAFASGAEGAEETEADGRFRACIYAPGARVQAVRERLLVRATAETEVGPAESPPDIDWSEAWKEGLEALRISPRLLVRPPFVEAVLETGQREIVIDPGQAFGTGGHASTRLCLEWIDALLSDPEQYGPIGRVLDVGTGSGVLALAAVALGARSAIGFDLDPVAVEAAQSAAVSNRLADRVRFFVGPIDALERRDRRSALVVANLLKREMLPIATALAQSVAEQGRLLLAGLLEEDVAEVRERFALEGLEEVGRRELEDAVGRWIGLLLGAR